MPSYTGLRHSFISRMLRDAQGSLTPLGNCLHPHPSEAWTWVIKFYHGLVIFSHPSIKARAPKTACHVRPNQTTHPIHHPTHSEDQANSHQPDDLAHPLSSPFRPSSNVPTPVPQYRSFEPSQPFERISRKEEYRDSEFQSREVPFSEFPTRGR